MHPELNRQKHAAIGPGGPFSLALTIPLERAAG
jgi:hypothetical protein